MTRYRVRADKRLLYRGKNAEKARRIFLEAGRQSAYSQAFIVLLADGKPQARILPRHGFPILKPASQLCAMP
ncbi:hypothetical protein EPA93_04545 [Ktedonosporobacter rubrisoli]|uniref:Uncharacterized protein n=1 Tax=Ktedonosporobacter rubrisoli TaxID=2509675 RepID=A0A4P6JJK9_KTERU|nr:hypothetical protein [Ktedonosporobacter rubrisoli]QBD75305.1 hypothetical protein EPA93_04545 [Ktedonosporobacter rubrisoli]